MRRPWKLFIFIVFLTLAAGYVAWPSTPINFKIGNFAVNLPAGTPLELKQGLDLQGGTQLTLQVDMSGIKESDRKQALDSATAVIDKRVNLFGVSEPVVQASQGNGNYRIIVELPGVKDVNQAVDMVGKTAQLEIREVVDYSKVQYTPAGTFISYTDTKPGITGVDLKSAQPELQNGQWSVTFNLTDSGAQKFSEITRRLVSTRPEGQRPLPIYLDQSLVSAPDVKSEISSQGNITGNYTADSAKALATQLNAGALPAPIHIIEQRTVGATIGDLAATRSLVAGILGLFVIAIFMIGLYRKYGLVASAALLIYTLIVLAIFKLSTLTPYGVTLTLAGIAGFILSVGMAVDANILVFERMREELRRGKPRDVALELGFARAWTSIRDSNITTMVVAVIIYYFTSSFVKGFALTLLIGVAVSMFTAIVVTRTLLRVFTKFS